MICLSKFKRKESVKVSCIYKVTNIRNGKVYIGQTINFRKRLSDYMNAHKKHGNKNIYSVIKEEGTENFTIEIIKRCSQKKLDYYENFYINQYKSYESEYGYNILKSNIGGNSRESRKRKSLSHVGLKESNETKKKKSNIIYACNEDTFIICDSGKLFGDYIEVCKDYIKNCLRQPSKAKGWRVYYNQSNKRQEIREKMYKKRYIRDKEYIEILDIIDKIDSEGVETMYLYFSNIKCLTYSNTEKYELKPYEITSEIVLNAKQLHKLGIW